MKTMKLVFSSDLWMDFRDKILDKKRKDRFATRHKIANISLHIHVREVDHPSSMQMRWLKEKLQSKLAVHLSKLSESRAQSRHFHKTMDHLFRTHSSVINEIPNVEKMPISASA